VHYTRGGPWFEHMRNCEFADEWMLERNTLEDKDVSNKNSEHYTKKIRESEQLLTLTGL
jgi:hypothetical protein